MLTVPYPCKLGNMNLRSVSVWEWIKFTSNLSFTKSTVNEEPYNITSNNINTKNQPKFDWPVLTTPYPLYLLLLSLHLPWLSRRPVLSFQEALFPRQCFIKFFFYFCYLLLTECISCRKQIDNKYLCIYFSLNAQ